MQRQAVVAGQFYAGTTRRLREDLATLIPETANRHKAIGIIAPHAGYIYSGPIAGQIYAAIEIPSTVLIIGPNHHGVGAAAALSPDGEWQTPLGSISINSRLNAFLLKSVPFIQSDQQAHRFEHSLEVQVPFIQYLRPDASICALCLGQGGDTEISQIGEGIAAAIRDFDQDVLIVASSDMTHYESSESANRKDSMALDKVLNFDPQGLLRICRNEHISMCGVVPVAVMLVAAKELGATHAGLVAYGTSGDVTGEHGQVVGYSAVSVW